MSEIKEKLPLSQKIHYALANMSLNSLNGIIGSGMIFFYTNKLLLDPDLVGIAWLIFGIWNAINDPLLGTLQDRTKTRMGRRIPYLRFGSFVYGALFILCWYPLGNIANELVLFFNLLLALCAFDTLFTMLGCILYPLPAEIAIKSSNRSTLMVWSNIIGGIFGLVTNVLVTYLLIGDESTEIHPLFKPAMIAIGILMSSIMFISSFFLKENLYTVEEEPLGFIESFKETFKNRPFIIYEAGVFLFLIAQTMLTTGLLYYINDVLNLSGIQVVIPYVLLALSQVGFSILANRLVPIYGLKKLLIGGAIWVCGSLILMFGIGWWFIGALIGLLIASFGIAVVSLTSSPLFADIIDYDEIQTGKRREASYSGIQAFLTKFCISIGNWLFLFIIKRFGYEANQTSQSQFAQLGIMLSMFVIPAIIAISTLLIVSYYPLYGPEWEQQKLELAKIHHEKEIEFLKKHKGLT
ncbi:MAG: MFS transporter [Candidatus Lokiarchaeota archaeon]|nr:MFS transporter [Candidatus Lokiarchaeota archaeon]